MAKTKRQPNIETIIKKAVTAGLAAGRREAEDIYKATEKRLYALPVLEKRIKDNQQRLVELQTQGSPRRSKDIRRLSRPGMRLSPDEILEVLIADVEAAIAKDEYEVETIKKALENIKDDPYYLTVEGRYFEQISDDEIAKKIHCDTTTVWRQRKRLVQTIAVWLYGADAV